MKRKGAIFLLSSLVIGSVSAAVTFESQYHFKSGRYYQQQDYSATCVSSDSSCWPTAEQWEELNHAVHGNLVTVIPPARSCYPGEDYDKATCKAYQRNYLKDLERGQHIGAMQNINWETCGENNGCLLNSLAPSLPQLFGTCQQGALPRYALRSTSEEDIATVIRFAQKHRIAFNIKNSGHDYSGRSTSPDSITIWTHPLQKIEFHEAWQPDQCESVKMQKAFVFGGGVKWIDAYSAAHEKNVTLVGGAQAGVSVAGGWLQGGGHSILTAAYGLGVDQVLQFKIILANGELVTVNKCQYPDLFWALRGGGGGTFGVVTEVAMKVHPHMTIQAIGVDILTTVSSAQKPLMLELARNALRWAEEGWGGYFYYYNHGVKFLYANPLLAAEEAEASMKPFLDFINSKPWTYIKKTAEMGTYDGFYDLFMNAMNVEPETVGFGARIASRLIPVDNFATDETREQLIDAFIEGTKRNGPSSYFMPTEILSTTSLRVQDWEKETSVQPMFRKSVWHIIYTTGWVQGIPESIKRKNSLKVSLAVDPIRNITPGSGAYSNEADVLEPNWQQSFWGEENYDRLLVIKQKYDPTNFFNCWKCVGWDESMVQEDKKYRCYQY